MTSERRCWADGYRYYVFESEKLVGKNFTRSFLYKRYKTLFWYLTLFDREWFHEHYPSGRRGATENLPSTASDRLSILQAIYKTPKKNVRTWKNLAQQAFFRASLRDIDWLEDRKRETAEEINKNKLVKKKQYHDACIDEFKQAFERVRALKGKSTSVSLNELASYTSLNESQLKHFLYKNPELFYYK
jgi:hypothetical protein